MWFLRHCTTRIVPAILCGQSRRLKSDESMTMSEYFTFLLPFTIQFILLTSYSHQYDGIWRTYILVLQLLIRWTVFATKPFISMFAELFYLCSKKRFAFELHCNMTLQRTTPHLWRIKKLFNGTQTPTRLNYWLKYSENFLQDPGPPLAIPQSF